MGLWGVDKPEQKRQQGRGGIGWLRSPDGDKVVRIEGAAESLHAKWVEVSDADITSSERNYRYLCGDPKPLLLLPSHQRMVRW